jgi:hypothetical protein
MIAANARRRSILLLLVAALGAIALVWGCSNNEQNPVAPSSQITLDANNPIIRDAMAVQDAHTAELMANQQVIGTATTLDDMGNPAILVLVVMDEYSTPAKIAPSEIDGYPVVIQYTERIVAMKGGGGGVSHKAIQTAPIQLGTSGGWRYDLANGYCCGGTLGSLVSKGGSQYVLSNYHVLEADIVNGGNSRVAQAGDPVIQPGLIDVNCSAGSAQNVATLSGIKSLPGSNTDCAIAQVISGMVSTNGAILEIGTISSSTVGASIGQAVKKSGRTTGLTRSSVSGLNANVSVAYENECAGGSAFTKSYTGQILISNNGSRFLAGGDSGSLMTEDVSTNPRAVGLLFAGSSSIAVANPIGQVLSFLGASMVGN